MHRAGILIALFVLASPLPAFAQTAQEEEACTPDANKYCKAAGDNQLRVLACLQKNQAKISKACRKVLTDHGRL